VANVQVTEIPQNFLLSSFYVHPEQNVNYSSTNRSKIHTNWFLAWGPFRCRKATRYFVV